MLKNITKLVLISFVVLFIANLSYPVQKIEKTLSVTEIKYVNFNNTKIKVELAVSDAERELGLSGRQNLSENEGMLFVFEEIGRYPFWMKDMNFPIDIIWLSENNKVIYIKQNAQPRDYPNMYGPEENAKYVLEVVAGTSLKNNLKVGDSVIFNY